jgi:hypothetical protein
MGTRVAGLPWRNADPCRGRRHARWISTGRANACKSRVAGHRPGTRPPGAGTELPARLDRPGYPRDRTCHPGAQTCGRHTTDCRGLALDPTNPLGRQVTSSLASGRIRPFGRRVGRQESRRDPGEVAHLAGMADPPPPGALVDFPSFELNPTQTLFRVHSRGRSPLWYCSCMDCRFDLDTPRGTCYASEESIGAFIEVFGRLRGDGAIPAPISWKEVDARCLSYLRVFAVLADCTSAGAARLGVTAEIHAGGVGDTVEYAVHHKWAAAFQAAGFDGIRFRLRHDPSTQLVGIALFGSHGSVPHSPECDEGLSPTLTDVATTRFGFMFA